jgi:hypothetical protein
VSVLAASGSAINAQNVPLLALQLFLQTFIAMNGQRKKEGSVFALSGMMVQTVWLTHQAEISSCSLPPSYRTTLANSSVTRPRYVEASRASIGASQWSVRLCCECTVQIAGEAGNGAINAVLRRAGDATDGNDGAGVLTLPLPRWPSVLRRVGDATAGDDGADVPVLHPPCRS